MTGEGCRVIWTSDAKPTRRCLTHEYDWVPPHEPICPARPVTGEANGLRDQVAEHMHAWWCNSSHHRSDFCRQKVATLDGDKADALLPLFERVQAEAWDKGYEARERDERREQEHYAAPVQSGCDCMVPTENPFSA